MLRIRYLIPAAAFALACDDSAGPDAKGFTIAANSALTLGQGDTARMPIRVQRNDFDGIVRFTVRGAPQGISAWFSGDSATLNVPEAVLVVAASRSVPPTTGTLTIEAVAPGATSRTATVSFTVQVTGTFSLGVLETEVRAAQAVGGAAAATVLVNRVGRNGSLVSLSATGMPAGVTARFTSSATEDAATTLWLLASAGAPIGRHSVTVTGTAAGLPQQTTTVTLDVIAPPATMPASFTLCGPPTWAAYQNDGYGWQRPSALEKTISFDATERLSIAYAFHQNGGSYLAVFSLSRAELALWTLQCPGNKSLSGTFAGVSDGSQARASMARSLVTRGNSAPGFSFSTLPPGPLDLVASVGTFASSVGYTPETFALRRGLDLPSGSSLGTVDFASDGIAAVSSNVSVPGTRMPDEEVDVYVNLLSAGNTAAELFSRYNVAANPVVVRHLPSAVLQPGDLHYVSAEGLSGTLQPRFRVVAREQIHYVASMSDRTFTLPPTSPRVTFDTIAMTPYPRLRARMSSRAEYDRVAYVTIEDFAPRTIHLRQTAAFLGSAPSEWQLIVPDFGDVEGMNPGWIFAGYWGHEAGASSAVLFGSRPNAGLVQQVASEFDIPPLFSSKAGRLSIEHPLPGESPLRSNQACRARGRVPGFCDRGRAIGHP